MKNYIIIVALLFLSLNSFAQQKNIVTIKGIIEDLPSETRIYICQNGVSVDTIGTTVTKNGKFETKVFLKKNGTFLHVFLDSSFSKRELIVFAERGSFTIEASLKHWPNATIKENKLNNELTTFMEKDNTNASILKNAILNLNQILGELRYLRDTKSSDTSRVISNSLNAMRTVDSLENVRFLPWKSYIKENPSSYFSAFLLLKMIPIMKVDSIDNYLGLLNGQVRESEQFDLLLTAIEIKKKNSLIIAGYLPEIVAFDVNRRAIDIGVEIRKTKITMLDFWASWCAPCREIMPELKELYFKYKDKGFNVVGISQDDHYISWVNAITKDKLPWLNVSDLQGNRGTIAKLFNIYKLPTSYLVDNNGKIILADATFVEIERYLKSNL
ncbi:thiol-disulfide isomerase/thioredoxin [Chitinophaga skermanii]|uniref:Thiol-disulfide isomerase/thioredoxin n=1 Tax=Chitinophaga skermanii TaxID=331697 RepID=A0A327R1G4_9BACT|nr:TlpA disulfide reductase family protein [Chitinophaga skermanii]RAJ10716.1 thiol-disulfide isomerase/thioredoxin [Chitinophaga skermanii]